MRPFLIFCGIASFVVLYLLTLSTDSSSRLAPYFGMLTSVAALLGLALFVVIVRYIAQIIRHKNQQVLGSQIARRLSRMFTLVAVLPALFLLGVAAQFIAHSIDSWFGDDTKEALERSLKLSQSALDAMARRSQAQAESVRVHVMTAVLQQNNIQPALQTEQARSFAHLAVWNMDTKTLIAERNTQHFPDPEWDAGSLHVVREQGQTYRIESLGNHLYTQGWLRLQNHQGYEYALFYRQIVPENVAQDAQLIESARAKYAELVFAQKGLQTFFLVTLVIATLLAILLALAAALYFAQRFVEPILQLSDGARAIAQGDFQKRLHVQKKDELGKLTLLFNHMTEQLAIAKDADERHRQEQELARQYLERVLDSLSAGVVTLDSAGCLNTYNRSAEVILDCNLAALLGQQPAWWANLSPQHIELSQVFNQLIEHRHQDTPIEMSYIARDESRILLGKAVPLPEENGSGLVLIFDNITTLVRAQKEAAWGEVAKRLAHEIRNPLTPIQLSAERLAWKLQDKLSETDAQILVKSTNTIVKQVESLKEMVEAFRNYARAPAMRMQVVDLNELVREVLVLYESVPCTFDTELSNIAMPLHADTTAMRQVLHNLFKNAAEAASSDAQPQVWITTQHDGQGRLNVIVQNNGTSFSAEMLRHAFEPYVTDKPDGTGLGLAVVKKIIDEHGGCVVLFNRPAGGACVQLSFSPLITES